MFVTVQLPIVDVRSLSDGETHRDHLPYFPVPDRVYGRAASDHHRSNFVRGLGAVRPRLQGGPPPWLSESYYVDVRRLVRVGRQFVESAHRDGRDITATPVYRNFYTDGVVGRVEVCFRVVGPRGAAPHRPEQSYRIAVGAPSRLRGSTDAGPLISLGPAFAAHLLRSTTVGGNDPPSWWVRAGTPAVIVEISRWQQTTWHSGDDPMLTHRWIKNSGVAASSWQMTQGTSYAEEFRRLRVHLSRLHADFVGMRTILGLCQSGQLDITHPPAERYIARTLGLLLRPARHGFGQNELLARALEHSSAAHADTVASLAYLVDTAAGGGLADRAGQLLESLAANRAGDAPRIVLNVRELVMAKNEPHIHGGTFTGAVNFGSGGAHLRVGPDAQQLAPLIAELFAAVERLEEQLPGETSDDARWAAQEIAAEAEKDPGHRSAIRLRARLDSLLATIATAGGAGTAIGQAVNALRAAFGL